MADPRLGALPAPIFSSAELSTEAAIADALPRDLACLLTGQLLAHLPDPGSFTRQCLEAAHAVLAADPSNPTFALGYLRVGLARAIQPDQIEHSPETILLQAAFWLLSIEAQSAEVLAKARRAGAAGAVGGAA